MSKRFFSVMAMLAVLSLVISACAPTTAFLPPTPTAPGGAIPGTGAQTPQPTSGAAAGVPEVIQAGPNDWPMANKDYTNARAVLNGPINSSNINQMGVAWTMPIPGQGAYGAASSNPIIVGNTVYFQDTGSNVFSLNLQTGNVQWQQLYNLSVVGPNGPAIGYGKIFAQVGSNSVRALDAQTGQEVWSTTLEHPTGAQQPYVYDGHVYTGTLAGVLGQDQQGGVALRGYAGGASGYVYSINQETGNVDWKFMTVENGFWGNADVNAGAGIWYPPAIDTATGLTYWGTGNPAPFPGTQDFPNASSRPGPNLYSSSILALNHTTGEMVWYNQLNPHDLFDHDAQISPVLATAQIGGQQRKIVIGSGKLGRVVAMDAETGNNLWSLQVGQHQNDDLEQLPQGQTISVMPGVYGGVETPMALTDGVLYVPVVNLPSPYTATGFGAANGTEAVQSIEGRTNLSQGSGVVTAINVSTGKVIWHHQLDQIPFGAATVVNDLLIVPTFDGTVHALLRSDGSEVWSWKGPTGINAWPAVSGDTIVVAAGAGSQPLLIALRLGAQGQIPTPAPTTAPTELAPTTAPTAPVPVIPTTAPTQAVPTQTGVSPTPTNQAAAPTTAPTLSAPTTVPTTSPAPANPTASPAAQNSGQQLISMGENVFLNNCSRCHGPNGQGSGAFPTLAGNGFVTGDSTQVIQQVLHGGGAMPAFADQLANQDIAAVVSYIRNSWGNNASTVTPDQVQQARQP